MLASIDLRKPGVELSLEVELVGADDYLARAMTLAILCSGQGLQRPDMFALTGDAPEAADLFAHAAKLIYFGTLVTHFFGGSAGREGTAVQMGGSIASVFCKWLALDHLSVRVLLMCGIAAGFHGLSNGSN